MSSISSRKSLAIISQGPHKAEVELLAGGGGLSTGASGEESASDLFRVLAESNAHGCWSQVSTSLPAVSQGPFLVS